MEFSDKVSIITPVYNSEKFIKEMISSVQNQSFENWELIIIDDCSNDNSSNIILELQSKDDRILYHRLIKNSGAAIARNTGLELAKGRFIAFLDSDDLWEDNKLEVQISYMKQNNIGFSFSAYSTISETGELSSKNVNVPLVMDYSKLLKNTIIGCLTVVIDRTKIGDFRMPNVRAGQDTATWLAILKKGHKAYGIQESLAKYRIVKGSLSGNNLSSLKRTWNVYKNIEKLPIHKLIFYYCFYILNATYKRMFKY
ncbi:glycosyltransferase family 2 protein [Exiguobacterium sp. s160]|uniref:glycosyltransferase family 2 protein n=1 Tax=Exiguobacterium sp. s160 TaxID=2751265 RepID=UPI00203731CE|nr:glycosyltransferase family 2 protein [Exiguobacterium sp. s160]